MTRWYGGYGTPLVTQALIHHHDGIVGPWGPPLPMGQLALDNPANLERWEPWVRVAVLDFELLSNLRITRHRDLYAGGSNHVSMTLWHINAVQNAALGIPVPNVRRIATLKRPLPAQLAAQLSFVQSYADLREDRAAEILAQLGPPIAFWSSIVNLHPDRTRWTLELIDVALRMCNWVEMRFKHAFACRRPNELSPQIQPMILTPGHGTWPSGHATEAFLIAYLLWRLISAAEPGKSNRVCEQLMRQASRIAINRTIAGVHYPIDSAAGEFLGLTLGEYLFQRCQAGAVGAVRAWRFDAERYDPAVDFQWRDQYNVGAVLNGHTASPPATPYAQMLAAQQIRRSPLMHWLWQRAVAEWP